MTVIRRLLIEFIILKQETHEWQNKDKYLKKKADFNQLETVQRGVTRMTRNIKNNIWEEELEELYLI